MTILNWCFTCILFGLVASNDDFNVRIEPGPQVKATQGMVWPKPSRQMTNTTFFIIQPKTFTFNIQQETCEILELAVSRYTNYLLKLGKNVRKWRKLLHVKALTSAGDPLQTLNIYLTSPCENRPYLSMDEKYALEINERSSFLSSESIWGILRGLETFYQLIYFTPDASNPNLLINETSIIDFPTFSHRGLHLDTARHFIPMRDIETVLEGMVMNKLNVFHWHIVDDQSFPYVSEVYPELSALGAYSPLHVYTPADIKEVVEFARIRGIRVIPEFDVPGHTRSWGNAFPEILTECYVDSVPDGSLGPMNPLSNKTFEVLSNLLPEVQNRFKDEFLHLGGDEVPFDCWEGNPEVAQYLIDQNITASQLEDQFIQKAVNLAENIGAQIILWQEIFDNGIQLSENVVIHVWKINDYQTEMQKVTNAGVRTILSSCWYLDHLESGGDWAKFYNCDPTELVQRVELILGGEACMWSEVVDSSNVLPRIWPRAAATAERLWSVVSDSTATQEVASRLEEHACRMNSRGIPSQPPNGPGFCPLTLYV